MKVSLYIEWKNQQMVEMRKLKKDWGGEASILINQIVSKLGTGASFTHNVYFYTTLLPKNKVFTM